MTRDEILAMPAGREMDVLVGRHVMDLVGPPDLYWEYSTDISAAWMVVEKFPFCSLDFDATTWRCELSDGDKIFIASSDLRNPSAPLAICRAALLSVMGFA